LVITSRPKENLLGITLKYKQA